MNRMLPKLRDPKVWVVIRFCKGIFRRAARQYWP